ncbi:MAG: nitroreductase family protein [Lachnospiraceae bacterium]
MVTINEELCIGCGMCKEDCIAHNIEIQDKKAVVKGKCMQCGHCVAICPQKAVSIPEYDMEDVESYDQDTFSLSPVQFLHAIKFRRSIRKFKQDKISKEVLEEILQAGRYTATAVNTQAVHYAVVQDGLDELKPMVWAGWLKVADELPKERAAFAKSIYGFYDKWLKNKADDRLFFQAPVFLVIATDNSFDDGLAAANIEMMAVAKGLGVLYNGYALRSLKNSEEAVKWLGLEGKNITGCMLLGYPDITYKRTAPRKKADILWK